MGKQNLSEEGRETLRRQMRERWQDPEYRARMSRQSRELWDDPEYRGSIEGIKRTEATKARMGEASRQAWTQERRDAFGKTQQGKTITTEQRQRLRDLKKGVPLSDEHRAKISEGLKQRPPATAEHRANISAGLKGKPKSPAHREAISKAAAGRKPSKQSVTSRGVDHEGNSVFFRSDCERRYFISRQAEGIPIRAYNVKRDGYREYEFNGKKRHYVPDFVELLDTVPRVVEVKYFADLDAVVKYENAKFPNDRRGDATRAKLEAFPDVVLVGVARSWERGKGVQRNALKPGTSNDAFPGKPS